MLNYQQQTLYLLSSDEVSRTKCTRVSFIFGLRNITTSLMGQLQLFSYSRSSDGFRQYNGIMNQVSMTSFKLYQKSSYDKVECEAFKHI